VRTREDVLKEFCGEFCDVPSKAEKRMADRIAALEEEKRHNVACVKWIANAFCDEHGNPRTDMPMWAHAVTYTLLLGLTPADAVVAQMELEARAEAGVTDEMVERAESAYDAWISANDEWKDFTLCSPDALRAALTAALTGGASA